MFSFSYFILLVFIAFGSYSDIAGSINAAAELSTHWIITATYIRVAYEARQMVNLDVYINNPEMMAEIDSFNRSMLVANIVAAIFIAANVACFAIEGALDIGKLFVIQDYTFQIMLWTMLAAWACALIKLYREVKHSEKLLPDKKLFILHGSLLTVYLILYLIQTIVFSNWCQETRWK